MNAVQIVGNLTRDIEIRYSQSGSAIGNTGIAVNKKWKDQQGQEKESVMFIDLTFFARTAEIANQYLRKSSKVGIVGQLDLQQWTAQDGTKRSKHVIIVKDLEMLGSKGDNQSRANQDEQADRASGYQSNQQQGNNQGQNNGQQGGSGYQGNQQQGNQQQGHQGQGGNGYQKNGQANQGGYSDPQGQRQ